MLWKRSRLVFLLAITSVVAFSLVVQPLVSAISAKELQTILRNTSYYGDFDGGPGTCGATTDGAGPLVGSDNSQKAFNYFKGKELTDIQSAAIVANLMAESGVNPRSNQGGGGPGRGIAQWTASERWATLTGWAKGENKDPLLLVTQLDFLWMELNGKAPAGDYSGAFKQFKEKSSKADKGFTALEIATGYFMGTSAVRNNDSASSKFIGAFGTFGGFENPGTPHLDRRFTAAKKVFKDYGSGTEDVTGGANVTGADAACDEVGAVQCNSSDAVDPTAQEISQVRQNVVCIALAELEKWDSGKMGPGGDFKTYSQGRDEEWCADFTSYVFNKAGYPINGSPRAKDGNVASVQGVWDIGKEGHRFEYHGAGNYVPVPGDIVIYKEGWSHVNIVVSVNKNKKSFSVVGGNQDGSSTANSSSKVTQYVNKGYTGNHITGYVSPKE